MPFLLPLIPPQSIIPYFKRDSKYAKLMFLSMYGLETFSNDLTIYETLLTIEHNERMWTFHFKISVM
jgi:hypothetical protein